MDVNDDKLEDEKFQESLPDNFNIAWEDEDLLGEMEDKDLENGDIPVRPRYWGLTRIYTKGDNNEPPFPITFEILQTDTLAVS